MSVVDDLRLITLRSEPSEAPYDGLARWLLLTDPMRLDAWTLVDDLSCAITMVVPEDNDRLTHLDPPDKDDTQHLLTRLIERFMGHKVVREPGLLRRPALQLVLCPRGAALSDLDRDRAVHKVELLHRRVESRVGLDLPDFKLTLDEHPRPEPSGAKEALEEPKGPAGAEALENPKALSPMARAFHLRFLEGVELTIELKSTLDGLTNTIDGVQRAIADCHEEIVKPLPEEGLQRALVLIDRTRRLRELPSAIAVPTLLQPQSVLHAPKAPPTPNIPFRLNVAARHWVRPGEPQPEHAASLPLGALSLVVADNAAGKTSAAETFSLLTADLPRARPLPPPGSERLDGTVTLDVIGAESALGWDNTSMLPIFSDDAELTEGTPGALSVATMWPSVASSETLAALGALARAARSFNLWSEQDSDNEVIQAVVEASDWDTRMTADLSALELLARCVDALFDVKKLDDTPTGLNMAQFDALSEWAGSVLRAPKPQAEAPSTNTDEPQSPDVVMGEDNTAAARREHAALILQQIQSRAAAPDDAEAAEALTEWATTVLSAVEPSARAPRIYPRPLGPSDETTDLAARQQEDARGRGARRLRALLDRRAQGEGLLSVDGALLDNIAGQVTRWARELARSLGPAVAPPVEALRVLWPELTPEIRDEILRGDLNEAQLRAVLEVEAIVQPEDKHRLHTVLIQARRAAYAEAKGAVNSWEAKADQQFERVLGVEGDQHNTIERATKRLDQLLTHDVWYDERRRRNTAALVRQGVAARLARAILLSPHSLPMLTLDEPTLGQHRVASARAIARITRLARVVEGRRWVSARHIKRERPPGPPPEVSLAAARLTLARPTGQEDKLRETTEPLRLDISARLDLGPPMLLIFSYQEDALTRIAQLEGEQLTHSLSESLQKLVAPWWRADLVRGVRACDVAWFSATSRELPRSPKPTLLLQQIEGALPDQPSAALTDHEQNEWLKGAKVALGKLGLDALVVPLALPSGLDEKQSQEERDRWRGETLRASRELIRWLALVELLPAVMDDAPFDLHTSGVELRRLSPEGGEAQRVGALRLRRVSPVMLTRVWAHDADGRIDQPTAASDVATSTAPSPDPAPIDVVVSSAVSDVEGPPGDGPPPVTEASDRPTTGEDTTGDTASEGDAATAEEPTVRASSGAQDDPPASSVVGDLALAAMFAGAALLADERTTAPGPQIPSPSSLPKATPAKSEEAKKLSRRAQLLRALLAASPSPRPEIDKEYWLRLDDLRFSKTGPPELRFDAQPEDKRRAWRVSVDCAPQDVTLIGDGRTIPIAHVEEALPLLTRAATLRGCRRTLLTLDCTQPVAVAAGFTHNLLRGHPVDVMAGIPGRDMARFVLQEPTPPSTRALTPREEPAEVVPRGAELHVLVTLTATANRAPYDRWRGAQTGTEGPLPGLLWFDGQETINDGAQAAWLARALHAVIVRHRPEGAALRLFLALPTVVCFALGQRLLNLGPVKLMELKPAGTREAPENTYEEWGTLKT
jgi:hypothetical protein